MASLPRPIARLCGAAVLGASVAACLLSTTGVAAATSSPCANTTDGISVVLASPSGPLGPACVTQQGNVLIIVLPQSTTGQMPQSLATPTPTATPLVVNAPATPTLQSAPEGDMSNVIDARINSYAKRQAIRDQYRGQIDEVTFNDELGDGVPLETALADAMAAFKRLRA